VVCAEVMSSRVRCLAICCRNSGCGRTILPTLVEYLIRSERLLMQEIDYNILFRWFVGVESG
jgi:hypothetical protein